MAQVYTNPSDSQPEPPHLLNHHRHQLEIESGIAPGDIDARGYYSSDDPVHLQSLGFAEFQCRPEMLPALVIPEWTTGGVQRGFKLKADHPRIDRKSGKAIKYESPAGSRLQIDCPPTKTHRLRNPSETLYVTEGAKKADAASSRDLLCVSLNGVYGFMRGRLVLDDLDDIALDGRNVRVAFDSDVGTKAEVADARRRLAGAFDRRGAKVSFVTFADSDDGSKVGFDDYFVAGNTTDGLDAITQRWTSEAPFEAIGPLSDRDAEVIQLRAENKNLTEKNRALTLLTTNPYLTLKQIQLCVRTINLSYSALSRNDPNSSYAKVEQDGRVRLETRHIANDHRPIPAKGEKRMDLNPLDDSKPIAPRSTVAATLTDLAEKGLINVEADRVRKTHPKTGDRYWDTEILFRPSSSPSEDLAKIASFDEYKKRKEYTKKPEQKECPHCGEKHEWRVSCMGCGTEIDPEKRQNQAEPRIDDVDTELETSPESAITKNVMGSSSDSSSGSAPITYLSTKNVMASDRPPIREEIVERQRSVDSPQQATMADVDRDLARYGFAEQWGG